MRIVDNSDKFMKALEDKAGKAFKESTEAVRKNVSRQAPVKTGMLRDSIVDEIVSDFHAQIGSEVSYAGIVEARTAFMRRGLMMSFQQVVEIFENHGFKVRIR